MKASSTTTSAFLLSLATAALAQSTSDSPYIPSSGISTACRNYLVELDGNTALASCSSALLEATSLFSPTASASTSPSSAQINGALQKVCTNTACDESTIKQALTDFSTNCGPELNSGNALVKSNYDVLYILSPFTDAICSKNTDGDYCATVVGEADPASTVSSSNSTSADTSATPSSGLVAQAYQVPSINMADLYVSVADAAKAAVSKLRRRQATSATGLLPNAKTFSDSGLPFLFISSDMTSAQLCTSCTKNILSSYIAFETDFPYAIGLANSPILSSQTALWKSIGGACGSGFLSAITSQSGSSITGAASTSVSKASAFAVAGAAGLVMAAFAL